jgi:membrane dipeptidase
MTNRVYEEAIVIDGACPLAGEKDSYRLWLHGGATAICPTVAIEDTPATTKAKMAAWLKKIAENEALLLVKTVDDIHKAKAEKRMGIILHFQNTKPIGEDLGLIDEYYAMGLRMMQLCYNVQNCVGAGCAVMDDKGLSVFGEQVIRKMEDAGIVVDVTHTGYTTTMEAIETAQKPVVCSHSNADRLSRSERNLKDDQIMAIAQKGGVIGLNGFPPFVARKTRPTVNDLLEHADYIAKLAGIDHVALGLDYWQGMAGIAGLPKAWLIYGFLVLRGIWSPKMYPPPPWHHPAGIETPQQLPNLATHMLRRGYSEEDVHKVLGGNWLRVFKEVW